MSKFIGYARVSKTEQVLDLQIDALIKAGCKKDNIFIDKISGAKSSRPGLDNCLAALAEGDTLIIWRLDRLGRSLIHLITLINDLADRKVGFKSIEDASFDTTTASGELMLNIFASIAQFERRLIQERTKAGLEAARARGKVGGRPAIGADDPKVQMAKQMHKNKEMPIKQIYETLGISKATFYRYIDM